MLQVQVPQQMGHPWNSQGNFNKLLSLENRDRNIFMTNSHNICDSEFHLSWIG